MSGPGLAAAVRVSASISCGLSVHRLLQASSSPSELAQCGQVMIAVAANRPSQIKTSTPVTRPAWPDWYFRQVFGGAGGGSVGSSTSRSV